MAAKPRVLVVEDDPEIRKLLRKYLDKLGLEVTEAGTGKAALAILDDPATGKFALVCLDLMLPELREVPVLIISARSMPPDRALAEEVGANAYLIKPIRWGSFAATVQDLVPGVS
jgi:DNA-binding response OmpR family regulator